MTVTTTQTIFDEGTIIEAGTTGEVLNVDDLGQTWVSFKISEVETIIYPFTRGELVEFTS